MRRWRQKNRPITSAEAMFSAANREFVPWPSPKPARVNAIPLEEPPPVLAQLSARPKP